MFAVCALLFLSLLSASRSAPLDFQDVLKPLDVTEPSDLEGRWALVAGSMEIIESSEPFQASSSVVLDFYNSTLTKAHLINSRCYYESFNVTFNGSDYQLTGERFPVLNGSLFYAPCADCMVLSFNIDLDHFKSQELCLFSRRRQLEKKELSKFLAQVKFLNVPPPYLMDPKEELCPALQRS